MDIITSLFGALEAGLSLWNHKEARKYLDKTLTLKRDYYEEKNKPRPNMAVLDGIEFELGLLVIAFSAEVKGPQATDTPK